jgi:hypothetical protein
MKTSKGEYVRKEALRGKKKQLQKGPSFPKTSIIHKGDLKNARQRKLLERTGEKSEDEKEKKKRKGENFRPS